MCMSNQMLRHRPDGGRTAVPWSSIIGCQERRRAWVARCSPGPSRQPTPTLATCICTTNTKRLTRKLTRRARAGPGPCSGPPGAHRPRRHPRRCRRRTSPACAHAREHCAASATVILYHVITPFSCIFHISYARVANETSYRWGVCVTLEHLPCAVVAFALDLF